MDGMTGTQATSYSRWMLILRAAISVIIGIMVLVWPGLTLITLVYLFGAFVLVDGSRWLPASSGHMASGP